MTWALGNLSGLKADLGDLWPDCKDDLTTEIAFGLTIAEQMLNLDVAGPAARTHGPRPTRRVAAVFDQVDFVICATNPDVAFPADVYLNTRVGDLHVEAGNNGALTIPANISGNPAISVPVEQFDGPAGRHADHRSPPRGRPAARPGPDRRAASGRGRWWRSRPEPGATPPRRTTTVTTVTAVAGKPSGVPHRWPVKEHPPLPCHTPCGYWSHGTTARSPREHAAHGGSTSGPARSAAEGSASARAALAAAVTPESSAPPDANRSAA